MQEDVDLRARERAELVATLRAMGPDAPTLCAGWTAADIAAHLAISEQAKGVPLFVFNGIRLLVPARLTRRVIDGAQATGDRLNARMLARGWDAVLARLAAGPPRLYRYGSLAQLRTVEEWIHHEDVRRASGLPSRAMTSPFEAALWRAGTTIARFPEFRLGREGLELDAGSGRRLLVGDGAPARVRVTGPPGELLLYLAGRGSAAQVSVSGDDDDIRSIQPGLRV
ncbi:MAG TPA: maleylpyruvate isomerase family mycothiol-dependent enzyme [Acidimicrobiales bacterium]|nr:maleylpyruvate isomerase family mycothiol-dependent enzyme [Acidimicrobiales bacterium]